MKKQLSEEFVQASIIEDRTKKQIQILDQRKLLENDFKMYGTYEEPLFLAKDVAEWIDYDESKVGQMIKNIDEDEKETSPIFYSGQIRNMYFLTEDGLYEVLMQSKKPIAKKFKKEIKKILRQIRKTGGYLGTDESMTDEEIMAKALLVAQNTINKKNELLKAKEEEIQAKEKQLTETKEDLNNKNKFINQIAVSENSLLVRECAKIASKNGVIIGERRLWDKLRVWGFIFKNSTEAKQDGIDRGYFEIVEGSKTNKDKTFTYKTTRVTGKGQIYIINRLLKEAI